MDQLVVSRAHELFINGKHVPPQERPVLNRPRIRPPNRRSQQWLKAGRRMWTLPWPPPAPR